MGIRHVRGGADWVGFLAVRRPRVGTCVWPTATPQMRCAAGVCCPGVCVVAAGVVVLLNRKKFVAVPDSVRGNPTYQAEYQFLNDTYPAFVPPISACRPSPSPPHHTPARDAPWLWFALPNASGVVVVVPH